MRSFLFVGAFLCAHAVPPLHTVNKPAKCILDSADSVNEMLDAALYMWAAIERCSGPPHTAVQCAIDVSSVVRSVNGILKFIMRAVDECSTIKTINHKCSAEAFLLGEGIAGLAKFSAGIVQKCTPHAAPAPPAPPAPAPTATCAGFVCTPPMLLRPQPERLECTGGCTAATCCLAASAPAPAPAPTDPCAPHGRKLGELCVPEESRRLATIGGMTHYRAAICAVEIKDSMKSVAKATVNIMTVKKSCDTDKWACTDNALRIIAAFADLATYLMGAVGHCSRIKIMAGIACASQIDGLIAELADVARASGRVNKLCRPQKPVPAPTIPVPTPVPTPTLPVPTPVPTPTLPVPTPVPTPAGTCAGSTDSDDCKAEYTNADINNEIPAFINRCKTETGATPLRTRCPACCASAVAPRLYAAGEAPALAAAPQTNTATFALGALLPISAVVGFFGGSKFGRGRTRVSQDEGEVRDIE